MASLPAVSKTMSSRGNVPFGANGSTLQLMQSAAFNLIQHLKDTASGGSTSGTRHANSVWTVKGSCDGTTANTAGSDLIAARTNLLWGNAGAARSWWWAENATLGYQIVIDCLNSAQNLVIAVAPIAAPFAGGTTTTRPVNLASEFLWNTTSTGDSSTQFLADVETGNSNYTHFACADDGQFFFLVSRSGAGIFSTFVALQKTTGTSDTRNVFLLGHSVSSARGAPANNTMNGTSNGCVGRNPNGAAVCTAGGVDRVYAGGSDYYGAGILTDAVSGKYNVSACSVWSATVGQAAYRGILPDLYSVPAVTVGSSIPSAAAQTRLVCGDFIIPFPGVVPIL